MALANIIATVPKSAIRKEFRSNFVTSGGLREPKLSRRGITYNGGGKPNNGGKTGISHLDTVLYPPSIYCWP